MNRRAKGIGQPPAPRPEHAHVPPPKLARGAPPLVLPPPVHDPAMTAPFRPDLDRRPLVPLATGGIGYMPHPGDPPIPTEAELREARRAEIAAGTRPAYAPSPVHEKLDAICTHIERGIPRRVAAHLESITESALNAVVHRNAEVEARIRRAEALGFDRFFRFAEGAALEGNTPAVTWARTVLERNYPRDFAPASQRIETTSIPATPAQLRAALEAAEEVDALEAELRERGEVIDATPVDEEPAR